MDMLLQDLRYALRALRKSPLFSVVAVLTLALGIGANTTIFTWLEGMVLRPLPVVKDYDRMVLVITRGPDERALELRRSRTGRTSAAMATLIEGPAITNAVPFSVRTEGQAERAWGEVVSANYFDVLGVRPMLGRGFLPAEDSAPGGHPVVVLSYGYWQRKFGGDPAIIGKTVHAQQPSLHGRRRRAAALRRQVGGAAVRHVGPALDGRRGDRFARRSTRRAAGRRTIRSRGSSRASPSSRRRREMDAIGRRLAATYDRGPEHRPLHRADEQGLRADDVQAGARGGARDHGDRAAHRLRERREPPALARRVAAPGNGDPARARRAARTARAPAAHREPHRLRPRRRRRAAHRVVGRRHARRADAAGRRIR